MSNFVSIVQYISLGIACFCGLVFTVLHETDMGNSYTALFLGLSFGWLAIFMLFICAEKCAQIEQEIV